MGLDWHMMLFSRHLLEDQGNHLFCFSISKGAEMAMTFTEKGLSFGCCFFFRFSETPVKSIVSPYGRGTWVINSHIITCLSNVAELIGEKGGFSGPLPS